MTKWTEYIIRWNDDGIALYRVRAQPGVAYFRIIRMHKENSDQGQIRVAVLQLAGIAILHGQAMGEKVAVQISDEINLEVI